MYVMLMGCQEVSQFNKYVSDFIVYSSIITGALMKLIDFNKQILPFQALCKMNLRLKMLGLYLYTIIIGHKSCNI